MKNGVFLFLFLSSALFPSFVSAREQSPLVSVDGDLAFSNLLPGFAYARNITVHWNVQQASLNGIAATEVLVQVDVSGGSENSSIEFNADNANNGKTLSFALKCVLQDGSCDENQSVLQKTFSAKLSVPQDAPASYEDFIVIQAKPVSQAQVQEQAVQVAVSPALLPTAPPAAFSGIAIPSMPGLPSVPILPSVPNTTSLVGMSEGTAGLGIAVLVLLFIGILLDKFVK